MRAREAVLGPETVASLTALIRSSRTRSATCRGTQTPSWTPAHGSAAFRVRQPQVCRLVLPARTDPSTWLAAQVSAT